MACLGNLFLGFQDFPANGALLALSQSGCRTGGFLAGNGCLGVTRCLDHFRSHFITAILDDALPAFRAAVLRAGGRLCGGGHFFLMPVGGKHRRLLHHLAADSAVCAALLAILGAGRILGIHIHHILVRCRNGLLRFQDFTADGAVAALGLAVGGTGFRDCVVGYRGVPLGGKHCRLLHHGIADGTLLAAFMASLGAGRVLGFHILHFLVRCRNGLLRFQDFTADGAVAALGLAVGGTGFRDCVVGFRGVPLGRNRFRSDFMTAALSGALPALGPAVLRAGGIFWLSRHVLLVLQSGNFLIAHFVAADSTILVFRPPSFRTGGRFCFLIG